MLPFDVQSNRAILFDFDYGQKSLEIELRQILSAYTHARLQSKTELATNGFNLANDIFEFLQEQKDNEPTSKMTRLANLSHDQLQRNWEDERDDRMAYTKRKHSRFINKFHLRIRTLVSSFKQLSVISEQEEQSIWWRIDNNAFIEQVPKDLEEFAKRLAKR